MFLCHPHLTQPCVILSSFLSLLAPCRTRHRESRQRLHEFGRPTVASGSIPALPTQQMLIQIRIKIIILIIIKKNNTTTTTTTHKTKRVIQETERREGREKKEGGRERDDCFFHNFCVFRSEEGGEEKLQQRRLSNI